MDEKHKTHNIIYNSTSIFLFIPKIKYKIIDEDLKEIFHKALEVKDLNAQRIINFVDNLILYVKKVPNSFLPERLE